MTPLVSIIVVSWNHCADLARCLCSLQAQAYPNVELIVVDNASIDSSADFVATHFPHITLIRNRTNVGFAAAVNQGFIRAHGDILVSLNPDTVVHPNWLAPLISAVQQKNVGLATARILLLSDPSRINSCGNESSLTGLTFCIGAGERAEQHAVSRTVPAISGAAFAIRRDCFITLGGFDATYFAYFEDTDLSWRARLAGYDIVLAAQSLVYHDYAFRFYPQKMYWLERNRYVTLLTCLRPITLLQMLPALLLGELIVWGFAVLQGRQTVWAKMRAVGWLIQNRAMIRQRRNRVMKQRPDAVIVRDMIATIRFEQVMSSTSARFFNALTEPLLRLNKQVAA